jgi:hypothetical protein
MAVALVIALAGCLPLDPPEYEETTSADTAIDLFDRAYVTAKEKDSHYLRGWDPSFDALFRRIFTCDKLKRDVQGKQGSFILNWVFSTQQLQDSLTMSGDMEARVQGFDGQGSVKYNEIMEQYTEGLYFLVRAEKLFEVSVKAGQEYKIVPSVTKILDQIASADLTLDKGSVMLSSVLGPGYVTTQHMGAKLWILVKVTSKDTHKYTHIAGKLGVKLKTLIEGQAEGELYKEVVEALNKMNVEVYVHAKGFRLPSGPAEDSVAWVALEKERGTEAPFASVVKAARTLYTEMEDSVKVDECIEKNAINGTKTECKDKSGKVHTESRASLNRMTITDYLPVITTFAENKYDAKGQERVKAAITRVKDLALNGSRYMRDYGKLIHDGRQAWFEINHATNVKQPREFSYQHAFLDSDKVDGPLNVTQLKKRLSGAGTKNYIEHLDGDNARGSLNKALKKQKACADAVRGPSRRYDLECASDASKEEVYKTLAEVNDNFKKNDWMPIVFIKKDDRAEAQSKATLGSKVKALVDSCAETDWRLPTKDEVPFLTLVQQDFDFRPSPGFGLWIAPAGQDCPKDTWPVAELIVTGDKLETKVKCYSTLEAPGDKPHKSNGICLSKNGLFGLSKTYSWR